MSNETKDSIVQCNKNIQIVNFALKRANRAITDLEDTQAEFTFIDGSRRTRRRAAHVIKEVEPIKVQLKILAKCLQILNEQYVNDREEQRVLRDVQTVHSGQRADDNNPVS